MSLSHPVSLLAPMCSVEAPREKMSLPLVLLCFDVLESEVSNDGNTVRRFAESLEDNWP